MLVMVMAVWSAVTYGVGVKYQVLLRTTYTYLLAINTTQMFISLLLILLLFRYLGIYLLLFIVDHYSLLCIVQAPTGRELRNASSMQKADPLTVDENVDAGQYS